ncbi:MAG TPA: CerR family C-terminal domain-containing protein [Steroidobacteraceae bacterium]|nr:CerR family C-terminal domain-containing protein [Steroidobacteraceae bacterium]
MRNRNTRPRAARAPVREAANPRRVRHRSGGGYARGEHTRRRLLEAAIELFGELGYSRASTRAIARRARVSLPALQYYFGGKEGLHRACAEYITQDVRARLSPATERVRRALGRGELSRAEMLELLRAVVEPFLEGLATERPESWALFFARAQGEHGVAFEAIFQQIGGPLLTLVTEIVSRILGRSAAGPEVAIRAVVIVGQLTLVRRARPVILRALGWPDFEGERLRTLKEVLWQGIAASLPSGNGPAPLTQLRSS